MPAVLSDMDDSELFNRNVDTGVLEAIGRFVFQGLPPGSLSMAILEGQPFEDLRRKAHVVLTDKIIRDTLLVANRLTPKVVKQNLTTWKGLWNESEARQMQWKLEADGPIMAWERKHKDRIKTSKPKFPASYINPIT